jgi:hypothetical protein
MTVKQVVSVRLATEDVELLDRLARIHGSRARAVRFLLRQAMGTDLALRDEIAWLRQEVAGLRVAVERLARAEVPVPEDDKCQPGDEEAVRQVLGALLSMSRCAKAD